MKIRFLIAIYLVIYYTMAFAQPDSLRKVEKSKARSYQYFQEKLTTENVNSKKANALGKQYLAKATAEENWLEMVSAYKIILHQVDKLHRISYADSMIIAAKHTGIKDLIGSAYLTKGIVYYDLKNHHNALDNYLVADQYISNGRDQYLQHKVKYNIAQIKYYLGYYEEALELFTHCIEYYKENSDLPYLLSLHSLGLCYSRIGNFQRCAEINELGINEATRLEVYEAIPRFVNSDGINQYFLKNHPISIAKINESLPHLLQSNDFGNIAVANFYLGKNYLAMNQSQRALPFFYEVDKSFKINGYMRPDLRETYEILIDYYKSKKDVENQMLYINQLLYTDQFINSNYKYLSQRIHKEYDTKKLLDSKLQIEKNSLFRKTLIVALGIIIMILFAIISTLFYRSIMSKNKIASILARRQSQKSTVKVKPLEVSGIKTELVTSIIQQLDVFEKEKKFLTKDITLSKLANMFESNIVYVSKIISHHKNKKSVDYINDLRVEFIIEMLEKNSKFRNYTNKALGEEAGFSTTQHFTRAFIKRMEMSPTDFIHLINKSGSAIKKT